MKKSFIVLIFFLLFSLNNLSAKEKIVFIDINFIFNNSDAGKDLKNQIFAKDNNLQNEIDNFKKNIDDERKKILSQKNVLSVEEYNKKVTGLEKKINEVNIIISQKRKDLKKYQTQIETKFSESLNILIEEFSVQNSIDIILKKENLLMAKKDLDITEKIFNLFNEKVKKIIIK